MKDKHKPTDAHQSTAMDIKSIIDTRKMSFIQHTTLLICFLMNLLNGTQMMIISYAAPSITNDWGISPETLGIVFSLGLLGTTLATFFLAPRTDVIGRRPMILLCAAIIGLSMFFTGYARNVTQLAILRFLSGFGMGGMLASATALTAEYTPEKIKDFWVSLVLTGVATGAVLTGIISAEIIPVYGWQTMFKIAGILGLLTIPFILFFTAESLDFLFKTRPKNALAKANSILKKMHIQELTKLPPIKEHVAKASIRELFTHGRKISTVRLWIAFFLSFASLYFLTNWIPELAENTGLSLELAIYAGMVFNLGAVFGVSLQGYFSSKFGLNRVIFIFLLLASIFMTIFGFMGGSVIILILFGLIGFTIQGGFVGLYTMAARLYPTQVRTTGIGWAIGAGRIGGVIGPFIAGILIGMGFSLTLSFIIFAVPALLSGIMALLIPIYKTK